MAATGTQGSVRTFDGSVHVRFLDTMLASTNRAAVMEDAERGALYLIPFDDVYFDYLARTDAMVDHPACGRMGVWRVSAAGRAEDAVMWTLDEPAPDLARFGRCAIFDGTKVAIEVVPADGTVV
jgi:uncharacterized protein (DUF427 family)